MSVRAGADNWREKRASLGGGGGGRKGSGGRRGSCFLRGGNKSLYVNRVLSYAKFIENILLRKQRRLHDEPPCVYVCMHVHV